MPQRCDDLLEIKELFGRAESFHHSAVKLGSFPVQISGIYFQGSILCSSCAVELYMKILAQIERNEPPLFGHEIASLVQDLSPKTQRRLKQAWVAANTKFMAAAKAFKRDHGPEWNKLPTNYESALAISSEAFIEWRYAPRGAVKGWFIGDLATELRKIILEHKPDWAPSPAPRGRFNPHP